MKTFRIVLLMLKRLFRKPGFLISLALMPAAALIVALVSHAPAAPLKVSVCCPGDSDAIWEKLTEDPTVIEFVRAGTPEEAENAVFSGRADAAWIFPEDLPEKLSLFAEGKRSLPFIKVIESAPEISARITHEYLFGAIFPALSEEVYLDFAEKNFPDGDREKMREAFFSTPLSDRLVEYETLESQQTNENENSDYILGVLRGLMALCVLLCALCGSVFTLVDDEKKSFVRFMGLKRRLPALVTVFGASFAASAAMFLCLAVSGTLRPDLPYEVLCLVLCALDCGAMAFLASAVFPGHGKLAASIPPILLASLALSPVFFNLRRLEFLQRISPIYWYLYSALSSRFIVGALIYAAAATAAALAIKALRDKKT
ncbi:MAG: ABC transporter permease [Clostridia bacterium]|nr:ABC transporter permease [Clostridia bacterium]